MANDVADWTNVIARPPVQLGGSPWSYGSGTVSKGFSIGTDVHLVSVILPDFANVTELKVTGSTSGAVYMDQSFPAGLPQATWYAAVVSSVDTAITVSITSFAAATAYVSGISDPAAIPPAGISPAPWQAPGLPPGPVNTGSLASGGTAILLPATASRRYYLHNLWISPQSAPATWKLQDTAAMDLGVYQLSVTGLPTNMEIPPMPDFNFDGAPLALGHGLQLLNQSAGAVTFTGHVTFSLV